jgi:hypothetical protein
MCLMVAVLATYSMVALAGTDRIAGELTVTGSGMNGETPSVTVNGETARSGRSIFSSSIITTPANASAVINLGKIGIIELAPNTSFSVSFNDKSVSGELTAGKLTVLGAANAVSVKTAAGQTIDLMAGESVNAAGRAQDDDATNGGGTAWWVWALVFGGAAAAVLVAAVNADNKVNLGGTAVTVSPSR